MGIQKLQPQNNITDWSKASVNKAIYSIISCVANENTFQTILNVSGKGYVNKAVINIPVSGSTSHLKITIDGVLKVYLKATSTSATSYGVIMSNSQRTPASSTYINVGNNSYMQVNAQPVFYPNTSNSVAQMLITQPIYFNTSLLIEVSDSAAENLESEIAYVVM